MTFRAAALLCLTLSASLGTSVAAHADVVLDQSYLVSNPNPSTVALVLAPVGQATRPPSAPPTSPPVFQFGGVQTFTAGTRGYLDHLGFQALRLTGNGVLIATLIDGDALAGSTNAIASASLPFALLPAVGTTTLSTPSFFLPVRDADYLVEVGQRYSVVFEAIGDPLARVGLLLGTSPRTPFLPTGTNYDGGAYNGTIFGVPASTDPGPFDVGFESFVDTLPVPVPSPAAPLALLGAAAVFALRRRRSAP